MTLSELVDQLVAAGWPRATVKPNGDLDLNTRPAGRGVWALEGEDQADEDGYRLISLHLPDAWFDPCAVVSIQVGRDTWLGGCQVWMHAVDEDEGPADLAWLCSWPGLDAVRQLITALQR
jgi:hypothetical protein